jgi:hypothetical protein
VQTKSPSIRMMRRSSALASLNRRSENVVIHPIIVAEIWFPKPGASPRRVAHTRAGLLPGAFTHGASGAESRRVPASVKNRDSRWPRSRAWSATRRGRTKTRALAGHHRGVVSMLHDRIALAVFDAPSHKPDTRSMTCVSFDLREHQYYRQRKCGKRKAQHPAQYYSKPLRGGRVDMHQ